MSSQIIGPRGEILIPPLPDIRTPEEILADALPLLDPPNRTTVTNAAEQFVRVPVAGRWQAFDRDVTPYMVEPADVTQDRRFKAVCIVGPSQSGKSQLLLSVAAHSICCNPAPIMVVHMTKTDADAWVEEKLDPAIMNSPGLRERLGRSRDDSTFSRKRFRGMVLTIGYPVVRQLSSRTQRLVLLSDYDHMDQRLGPKDNPEGTPFALALNRIRTFRSSGCVVVESTPAFEVSEPGWKPSKASPHQMPPVVSGVVPIYNEGTRARWYWECPDCSEIFEPSFERLHFLRDVDPQAAGESAEMQCPHCGSLIPPRHKAELNRIALTGRGGWLHEGRKPGQLVQIGDQDLRPASVASYAIDGAAVTFASWSGLVTGFLEAEAKFKRFDDELDLAKWTYTDLGRPYLPRRASGEVEEILEELRGKMIPLPRETAPDWVRFVTVSIDVQDNRFPVMVLGWALDGRRTIIDRFDLHEPPKGAPGGEKRTVQPPKFASDWSVLDALEDIIVPIGDGEWGLQPVALVVDYQGSAGVSDNAEKFWRARRKAGRGARWFLSRGHGGLRLSDRVWWKKPETRSGGKKAPRGIRLLNMATDPLKDTVSAALMREPGQENSFPLPQWMAEEGEEQRLTELIAERRTERGWESRPGLRRNETFDLAVQGQALAEHKGLRRMNPEAPPFWAEIGEGNPHAVRLANAPEGVGENVEGKHPQARRSRVVGRMKL